MLEINPLNFLVEMVFEVFVIFFERELENVKGKT